MAKLLFGQMAEVNGCLIGAIIRALAEPPTHLVDLSYRCFRFSSDNIGLLALSPRAIRWWKAIESLPLADAIAFFGESIGLSALASVYQP
ncbi:MAG: hypothetical protein ABIO46_07855 [Chitinophagales bacterium]